MPEMKPGDRNIRLRANYERLKQAGFTSAEARRFRGASEEKIRAAIARKTLPEKSLHHVMARKDTAREPLGIPPQTIQKGRIQYDRENHIFLTEYSARYNYVVAYQVRNPDGSKEWKYLTVATDNKLTKKELMRKIRGDYFGNIDNLTKYVSKPLLSSIVLTHAYENPNG